MTERSKNKKVSQGEKRHEAMIEAAWKLFLERDYSSVSLDDIIRISGGSKATFYKRFRNKEGILAAVIDRLAREMIEGISLPKLNGIPTREALRQFGLHLCGLALSDMAIRQHRLAVSSAVEFPKLSRLWYETGPNRVMSVLGDYFSDESKAGRLKIKNPAAAARMFAGMILFDYNMRLLIGTAHPSQAEIKETVNEATELFLNRYLAK